jgi:hypothetical protein
MNDKSLREQLANLLVGRGAHVETLATLSSFPTPYRSAAPIGSPHTPWQLLEHMRIAQWDILRFTCDPDHVSPPFPDGYWPADSNPPDDRAWDRGVESFRQDLEAMQALLLDPQIDLRAAIPHGEGQTVLREALVLADHNAYHLGQLVLLRRILEQA